MKSVNSFFNKAAFCAVLAVFVFALSCKSSPKNAAENTGEKAEKQISGQWNENEMSEAVQLGYFYTGDELKEISSAEVEFKKESGYEKSAFGLVFGYVADDKGKLSSYVRFEITVDGEYALYSVNGSSYTDLVEPNGQNTAYLYETANVKKGYGSANTLKIKLNQDGTYACYINGAKAADGIPPVKNGVNNLMPFFSVGKQNQEKFPDTPVRVSYRIVNAE
ncbi:hypothetical protein H0R92_05790 [Treponema sp. OMZ 840]|uniref:hypothetical protein n=1 Tax=Treponema sp. OMZ 840 TaxID=244313 RepID=UPI003D8C5A58